VNSKAIGLTLLLALGCGGAEPAPNTAAAANSPNEASETAEPVSPEAETPVAAAPDECADGGCTHCGDAVCLQGFYCDEGAQACGWVPACAQQPSCACLEQALPGCRCEERDGSQYLHCD
jgi:hypothetical protein